MKTAICSALAGAALLASAGVASAGEPVELSDVQMDGVTAGAQAEALAAAATQGDLLSETLAETETLAEDGFFAAAEAESAGLAASVFFEAVSESVSETAAVLP
jgi:hypothetical protein